MAVAGKFELRFLTCDALADISPTDSLARAVRAINIDTQRSINLDNTFYGVFKRGNEVILYFTEPTQERKIVESAGVSESEGAPPQEAYANVFNQLWELSTTKNPIPERIQQLKSRKGKQRVIPTNGVGVGRLNCAGRCLLGSHIAPRRTRPIANTFDRGEVTPLRFK